MNSKAQLAFIFLAGALTASVSTSPINTVYPPMWAVNEVKQEAFDSGYVVEYSE